MAVYIRRRVAVEKMTTEDEEIDFDTTLWSLTLHSGVFFACRNLQAASVAGSQTDERNRCNIK